MEIKKYKELFSTYFTITTDSTTEARRDARKFMESQIRKRKATVPAVVQEINVPYSRHAARFSVGHEIGHGEKDNNPNTYILALHAVLSPVNGEPEYHARLGYKISTETHTPEEIMIISKGRDENEMSLADQKWYEKGEELERKQRHNSNS